MFALCSFFSTKVQNDLFCVGWDVSVNTFKRRLDKFWSDQDVLCNTTRYGRLMCLIIKQISMASETVVL